MQTKNTLQERDKELSQALLQNASKRKRLEDQLRHARSQSRGGIPVPNELKVRVIAVENAANYNAVSVEISQHGQNVATDVLPGSNANFNQLFSFDIDDEARPLLVTVLSGARSLLQEEIDFATIRELSLNKQQSVQLFKNRDDASSLGINLELNFIEQMIPSLERQLQIVAIEMENDVQLRQQVLMFIKQLSQPFGFIQRTASKIQDRLVKEDEQEEREE